MSRAYTLAQLREMSDDDIVLLHDAESTNTFVGLNYFLDELRRRETERGIAASTDLARKTFWLSVASSVLALASVIIAVIALLVA